MSATNGLRFLVILGRWSGKFMFRYLGTSTMHLRPLRFPLPSRQLRGGAATSPIAGMQHPTRLGKLLLDLRSKMEPTRTPPLTKGTALILSLSVPTLAGLKETFTALTLSVRLR